MNKVYRSNDGLVTEVDITNLDAINDPAELRLIAEQYTEVAKNFTAVADYAKFKAIAVRNRAAGNIERALDFEMDADAIYASLDDAFKW